MDAAKQRDQRDERRRAQQELARAAIQLAEHKRLSLAPLLDAYRRLAPEAHAGANQPLPDLTFLQHVHAFSNLPIAGAKHWLLATQHPRTETLFHETKSTGVLQIDCAGSLSALADLMTLALGVCLEAQKIRALLRAVDLEKDASAWLCGALQCEAETLSAALGSSLKTDINDNELISRWVEQGDELTLHHLSPSLPSAPPHRAPVPESVFEGNSAGPLFIVAGATERIHDLLSPYVRRLHDPLQRLAAHSGQDAPYIALSLLNQAEPQAHPERLALETDDGFVPTEIGLSVSCHALVTTLVDERARRAAQKLKQSQSRIVLCDQSAEHLASALSLWGKEAHALVLLNEGFHAQPSFAFPAMLEDVASGHLLPLQNQWPDQPAENHIEASESVPSLGLASNASSCTDTSLYALANECFRARKHGYLKSETPIHAAICRADEPTSFSRLSIAVLETLAQWSAPSQTRPPSPLWQRQFLR